MIFEECRLKGAYIIIRESLCDERGFFQRNFCKKEFEKYGLCDNFVQQNISYNKKKGIIRGMHFQREPYQEEKLVQCIKGRIYDVIVDLREDSDTYLKWIGIELTETNNKSLYIPKGFAHGFQVLEDDSVVLYNMGQFYREEAASGIHYASPSIAIQWPLIDVITSLKDEQLKKI